MARFSSPISVLIMLVISYMLAGPVPVCADEGKIPITASSEKAREFLINGREMLERFRLLEARELLEKALSEDPNLALAHLYMSATQTTTTAALGSLFRAMELQGRVSEGEQLIIRGSEAAFNREPVKQRLLFNQLVTAYPSDERAHIMLGNHFFEQQMYALAVEKYKECIALAPDYSLPYNMLGYSYRSLDDFENAEKAFQKYIELIPNDPNPYDSYAELLLRMGKFDASIESYRKALAIDPMFTPSHIGIATNLNYKGEYRAARQQLKTMYDNASDDRQRREALYANAVSFVDEGQIDQALEQLSRRHSLSLKADDQAAMADNLGIMSVVLFEAGRYAEARARYEEAVQVVLESDLSEKIKERTRVELLYGKARLALATGDIETARRNSVEFGRLVSASENKYQTMIAHEIAGLVAIEEQDFYRAVEELKQTNPQNSRHLFELAQAYDKAGDKAKARELYATVADFNTLNNIEYGFVRHRARQALSLM